MIDQSAAYDLLDHYLLPKKLKEQKFDEASTEWIQSYLGERKHYVKIESKNIYPRESVLAGICCFIYSIDMPDCHVGAEAETKIIL